MSKEQPQINLQDELFELLKFSSGAGSILNLYCHPTFPVNKISEQQKIDLYYIGSILIKIRTIVDAMEQARDSLNYFNVVYHCNILIDIAYDYKRPLEPIKYDPDPSITFNKDLIFYLCSLSDLIVALKNITVKCHVYMYPDHYTLGYKTNDKPCG